MCCRELDGVRVKGKIKPVKIYELLGEKKDEPNFKDLIDSLCQRSGALPGRKMG